jgi:hypothetical protein
MTVRSWMVWPRMVWPFELAVLVIGDVVYERIRAMAPTRETLAYRNADRLLALEPGAVERFEHWLNQMVADHHWLALGTGYYYFSLHLTVTASLLFWLWWRRPGVYPVARSALLILSYGALVFFWLLPVAPPRLVIPDTFDTLAALNLGVEPGQTHGLVNEFAAFPSLHVGWAIWCAWALVIATRHRLRHLAWAYPLLTTYVVVATANHYLIDVAAGAAAVGLVIAAVGGTAPVPAPARQPVLVGAGGDPSAEEDDGRQGTAASAAG